MNDRDSYEFGKAIGNNSIAGQYSGVGTGGCMIWIIGFIVVAIIGAIIIFFDESGKDNESTQSTQATEQTSDTKQGKTTITEGKSINVTDNYTYRIPQGSEEIDKRLGSDYSNEQNFGFEEDNGNYVYITSFCIENEPECFPDLAEYLIYQGDKNAVVGYGTFEDTAMATSTAKGYDADGEKLYITSYWWPDGGSTLCCVEVASYSRNTDVPEFVKDTIKGKDYSSDYVPPGAEDAQIPDYNEIMTDEIKNGYMEDYNDSFGGSVYEPYHW